MRHTGYLTGEWLGVGSLVAWVSGSLSIGPLYLFAGLGISEAAVGATCVATAVLLWCLVTSRSRLLKERVCTAVVASVLVICAYSASYAIWEEWIGTPEVLNLLIMEILVLTSAVAWSLHGIWQSRGSRGVVRASPLVAVLITAQPVTVALCGDELFIIAFVLPMISVSIGVIGAKAVSFIFFTRESSG